MKSGEHVFIKELTDEKKICPPKFLASSVAYMTKMGSFAYGTEVEGKSDIDVYGFCIPPLYIMFPYRYGGFLENFGRKPNDFKQWSQHHVEHKGKEYDFSIYSITRYMNLAMENNPNMVDSLFTPERCVMYTNSRGKHIRDHRKHFLHKGCYHKLKGYAFSQLHKIKSKKHKGLAELQAFERAQGIPHTTTWEECLTEFGWRFDEDYHRFKSIHHLSLFNDAIIEEYTDKYKTVVEASPNRAELIKVKGEAFDYKFAYHTVRLVLQAEDILINHDLDLQRNKEQLKAIRRGEWDINDIDKWFKDKEAYLDKLYAESKLRMYPDETFIRKLLMECLEMEFGTIDNFQREKNDVSNEIITDLQQLLRKYED